MTDQTASLAALVARLESLLAAQEVQPVPVAEWRSAVLSTYASRQYSTRYRMKQALDLVVELLGPEASTTLVDAAVVSRVVAARPKWRAAYINGVLRALRAACRLAQAKSRRWMGNDQLAGATWIVADSDTPLVAVHSREDVWRVLTSLKAESSDWRGHRLYVLASLYAYTGVRLREGLYAKVDDVDLRRRVLFVLPHGRKLKTQGSRQPVPICDALAEVLSNWFERVESEWLIPTSHRKRPWVGGPYGFRPTECLVAAGQKVGVKGFTPQSLRHAVATHLIGHHKLSDRQVQLMLRHTNTRTQRHYVHPEIDSLAKNIQGFQYGSLEGES